MDETIELELSNKQQIFDQVSVTVLSGLAGLVTSKLVEKGYRFAVTTYRLRKAAA